MVKRMLLPAAVIVMALTAPAAGQTVFVSNEEEQYASVIDAQTLKVTKTIKVGKRPRGITLNADGSLLYICASDDNTVQVMDTATGKILHNLPSGEDPEQFALHPDEAHLFIANEDSNVVTVVDVPSRKVAYQIEVGVEPEGMAVSPDGTWAVNTSETTNMVHWIDTRQTGAGGQHAGRQPPALHAEFDQVRKEALGFGGDRRHRNDHRHGHPQVRTHDPVPVSRAYPDKIQPVGVRLSDDGRYAFVALGPANHVAVVDAQTFEVENTCWSAAGSGTWIHPGPEAAVHLQWRQR